MSRKKITQKNDLGDIPPAFNLIGVLILLFSIAAIGLAIWVIVRN
jgi:hypothetical protein